MGIKQGLVGVVVCLALLSSGCPHADTAADWVCSDMSATATTASDVAASIEELVYYRSLIWPEGRREISVCWEDETWDGTRYDHYREVVREAVATQWELNLATLEDGTAVPEDVRVHFVGWGKCSEGHDGGIRIRVADERPYSYVGTQVAGVVDGMLLNFRFREWNSVCSIAGRALDSCVRSIAVHEFGHALGFAHEQNRNDTPASCDDERFPPGGDFYGGTWDLSSVMNYCNPHWNNDGQLSLGDQRWSRVAYYPQYYSGLSCEPLPAPSASAAETMGGVSYRP